MAFTNDTKDRNGKSINDYKADYAAAAARNDAAGMKAANDAANAIRVEHGFGTQNASADIEKVRSGGTSGIVSNPSAWDRGDTPAGTATASLVMPGAVSPERAAAEREELYRQQLAAQQAELERQQQEAEELLRRQKAAELESALGNLSTAYQQSMAGYNQQSDLLPQTYESARNATAAQNAQAQTAFDERALAMGLSSGARGQAQLSRSTSLQNALAQIDQQQANAQSDLDLARNNLTANYNNTVNNARAQNEAALTSALYQDLIRQQAQQREDAQVAQQRADALAQLAAGYGDYSLLNEMGIDTSAYEAQQAALQAQQNAYKPTFTAAQVIAAKKEADRTGTQLAGNMLRDYNYYFFGDDGSSRASDDYMAALTGGAVAGAGGNTPASTGGVGYNNGGLDGEVVRQVQRYFGLDADGYWGPRSQSETGFSNAQEAYNAMTAGYSRPDNSGYIPVADLNAATNGSGTTVSTPTQQATGNPFAATAAANGTQSSPVNPYTWLSPSSSDKMVIGAARQYLESNPGTIWNSRTVSNFLSGLNLTAEQRGLFLEYLRQYAADAGYAR